MTLSGVGSTTPSAVQYSVEDVDGGAVNGGSRQFVLSRPDDQGKMAVVAQLTMSHVLETPKLRSVGQMMAAIAILSAKMQQQTAEVSDTVLEFSKDQTTNFAHQLAKKLDEASKHAEKMAKKQKHNKFWKGLAAVFSVAATVVSLGTATPLVAGIIVGTLALGVATNAVMNSKFAENHPKFAKAFMCASMAVQIAASLVTLRLASAGASAGKLANAAEDVAQISKVGKTAANTGMLMAEAESGAQMADDLVNGAKMTSQGLMKGGQAADTASDIAEQASRLDKMTRYLDKGVAYGSFTTNSAKTVSTVDLAVSTGKQERLETDVDEIDNWQTFYRNKMNDMMERIQDDLKAVDDSILALSDSLTSINDTNNVAISHIGSNPRGAI